MLPEGKDDKPQRPGELAPLHKVVALPVVPPPFPLTSLRHLMRLAMEKISHCKYSDWCLTDPGRRQQNAVTSVAITGGSDFTRGHIGRNAIASCTLGLPRRYRSVG
jgi:hypothetical protein